MLRGTPAPLLLPALLPWVEWARHLAAVSSWPGTQWLQGCHRHGTGSLRAGQVFLPVSCVVCRGQSCGLTSSACDERDLRDHVQAGLPSRQLCDLGLAFKSGCGSSLQRRPLNPLVPRPSSPRVGAAWGQDRTAGGADSHGRGTQPRVKGVGVHHELQSEGYRDQDSRHGFGVARDRGTGTQR